MSPSRIALFLVGCTVVLMVFAFVWPLVALAYAQLQIFCIKPFVNVELRVDAAGIAVYQNEKLLARREFLSFGGLRVNASVMAHGAGLFVEETITLDSSGIDYSLYLARAWAVGADRIRARCGSATRRRALYAAL
jgi:hypothetical protein